MENKSITHSCSNVEDTVVVWATPSLTEAISGILADMDAEVYVCDSAIDLMMIPSFIQIIDGHLLINDDRDLYTISCMLTDYSGNIKQCGRCRHHQDCLTDAESWKTDKDAVYFNSGPKYRPPMIMLNAEAKQRDVDGLLSLLPPMKVEEVISDDFAYWLLNTVSYWHRKVLAWRVKYQEWDMIETNRWLQEEAQEDMKITSAEIAKKKWHPRSFTIELRSPDFI